MNPIVWIAYNLINQDIECACDEIMIKEMDEMYYAQCPKCNKHDPYEFLGITKKKAIDRWNNCQCSRGDDLY